MSEINYDDKVDLVVDTGIDNIFKVTASDMNEIKNVVNGNAEEVGDITSLTTTDKTNVVNAVNELNAPEKWVSVGTTAPTDGRRVWFENSVNMFDGSTLVGKTYNNAISTTCACNSQAIYLEPGTYTFTTNIDTSTYEFKSDVLKEPPTTPVAETYIHNSGFGSNQTRSITISTGGYFAILIRNKSNTDLNLATLKGFQYQLQKGSTATSYETYIEPSINVDGEKLLFDNYSTNEQRIGTWLDGKPLYRKSYPITSITSSNTDLVDVSDANIQTTTRLYGILIGTIITMPMPLTDSSTNYNVIQKSGNKIRGRAYFGTGSFSKGWITIEYTKTTD